MMREGKDGEMGRGWEEESKGIRWKPWLDHLLSGSYLINIINNCSAHYNSNFSESMETRTRNPGLKNLVFQQYKVFFTAMPAFLALTKQRN